MTTRKTPFEITIDNDAAAAYIRMTNRQVHESVEIGNGIIIDLDSVGVVTGIEILDLETEIPFQRLIDEFHVHAVDVQYLRLVRPSISGFLMQFATDGTTDVGSKSGTIKELVSL